MYYRGILTAALILAVLSSSCAALVLYQEDFNFYPEGDLPNGWSVSRGSWEIMDDALACYDPDSWGAIRYDGGAAWTDYVFSADANLEFSWSPSEDDHFAIGSRVNAGGGGYWLIRGLAGDGTLTLVRTATYDLTQSTELGSAVLPVDGLNHTFYIDIVGPAISVFVDQSTVPLIHATDAVYANGSIAFESYVGCLSVFDNVLVDDEHLPEPSSFAALLCGLLGVGGAWIGKKRAAG